MEIIRTDNALTIKEPIRTLNDYLEFRDFIQKLIKTESYKELILNIIDSTIITSSIIGFLIKLIHLDGIKISLNVKKKELYDMMENLNLLIIFNVTKI